MTNRADLSAFTDSSKISFWAEDAMKWAVGEKRITDMTATTFFPDGNATRAQVAGIFMRFTNE